MLEYYTVASSKTNLQAKSGFLSFTYILDVLFSWMWHYSSDSYVMYMACVVVVLYVIFFLSYFRWGGCLVVL